MIITLLFKELFFVFRSQLVKQGNKLSLLPHSTENIQWPHRCWFLFTKASRCI